MSRTRHSRHDQSSTEPGHEAVKPTFLYVGASRAGSTWIYQILAEHPEVFVPPAKDVMFFDRYFDRGPEWYFSFFEKGAGHKAVGELSHDYFLDPEYARRIRDLLPDVRIFCCLRETVDKTLSMFLYNRSTTPMFRSASASEKDITFEAFAELPEVVRLVDYYRNLKPFDELFPREHMLVQFFDDLQNDPAAFARELYGFLGVDPDFQPPSLLEKFNVTRAARSVGLAHVAYRAGQMARRLGLMNVVGNVKHSGLFERLLYKRDEKPTIPREVRARLQARYTRDFDRLEAMIGRPLPEAWFADAR
jgi:hypothetical protein